MKRMVENRRGSDMAQGTRSDIKLNELLRVTTIFLKKHYMEGEFLFITVDKKYMIMQLKKSKLFFWSDKKERGLIIVQLCIYFHKRLVTYIFIM